MHSPITHIQCISLQVQNLQKQSDDMLTRSAEHVLHTLMTHTLSPFPVPWAGIKEWTSGLSEYFHSNCTVDQKKQAVPLQRKKFFYEQLQPQSNWKPQMQNNYYSFLPPTRNNMNFYFTLGTSLTITVLLYCNTEKNPIITNTNYSNLSVLFIVKKTQMMI